jgi:hypothetical protein
MSEKKIFIQKYRLTKIIVPVDGESGPTELYLVPAEETAEDVFTSKYVLISTTETIGRPLVMHVDDIRILKLLKVGKLYNVTFQETHE